MKLTKIFALVMLAIGLTFQPALADIDLTAIARNGGDRPFPGDKALPIEWDSLEGYWQADGGSELYVSFRVLRVTNDGDRQVAIELVDKETGEPVAIGAGMVLKQKKTLEAFLMTLDTGKLDLKAQVGTYDLSDSAKGTVKKAIGVTFYKLDGAMSAVQKRHFVVNKVGLLDDNPAEF